MHITNVYNMRISKTYNKRIENHFIIHMIYASVNRTFYRLNSCSEKLFANVREKQEKCQNIFCNVVNLRKKSTSCDTKMAELSLNKKSTTYVTLSPYGYKKIELFSVNPIHILSHPFFYGLVIFDHTHFRFRKFIPVIFGVMKISYQLYKRIMLDQKDKIDHLK